MSSTARTSIRRRSIAGVTAIAAVAGVVALMSPVASSSAGENLGTPVAGPAADPAVAKQDRWAVINADGSIARGKGVVSATNLSTGNYEVIFNKPVTPCLMSATIGLSGSSGTELPGFITTVGRVTDVNGVFVTTDDTAGASANRGFHLYIGC